MDKHCISLDTRVSFTHVMTAPPGYIFNPEKVNAIKDELGIDEKVDVLVLRGGEMLMWVVNDEGTFEEGPCALDALTLLLEPYIEVKE